MRVVKIEIARGKNKKQPFHVRIKAKNSEIVLSGETTVKKPARMIKNLAKAIWFDEYEIVDLT